MTDPAFPVLLEDDPTPLVLSVGRTLRASARVPELLRLMETLQDTVVVRSKDDPQAVTIRFGAGRATVDHGAVPEADAVLTVDLADRFAVESVDGAEPGSPLVAAVRRILEPPLPPWRDAARSFWEFTSQDAGMPHELVIACGEEELVLGAGSPRYLISGEAQKLSRVLTGTDFFLDEVYTGSIAVRGTMTQLSVMAGASLKVRFHA
ncbi:SCP2 sterol-binding domain-containing protein [Actinacidiphila oryziradicis]|uniref:SCP2 sterol-binding domain-containing protein n=1 Tax=Actinacidiphila oryziradicis TaxID=2571141 RepID=A0A4U0S6B3_9ACTN|nr:SCP2 sterol-binding domain-containing protein [Actinacidiphila oryziradicis]TKA04640.1 SCP2 sterol-binding domain-containing protein [Actinacidiphila oryziradicis]